MKNKIVLAVIALIFLLGLFLITKNIKAMGITDQPCCQNDPIDGGTNIDVPAPTTSHRSSGSYIKPIAKPVMVYDVIKFGDMGQAVKDFQMFLNNKGAKLVVDGIFGDLTQKAWLEFEKTLIK